MGFAQARLSWMAILVLRLIVSGFVGCGGVGEGQKTEGSTLTVLAAASLIDAFGELESIFEEQNPGTDMQISFAGSSELLTQI